jgi:hypothetical protein
MKTVRISLIGETDKKFQRSLVKDLLNEQVTTGGSSGNRQNEKRRTFPELKSPNQ